MDVEIDSKVDSLKRELIKKYVYFMFVFQIVFFLLFYAFDQNRNSMLMFLPIIEFAFIFYTHLLIRKDYNINQVVTIYLAIAPILLMYSIINFWAYGLILIIWLTPIPFGASIFFTRKKTILFTCYTIFLIVCTFIISYTTQYKTVIYNKNVIRVSDLLNILFNGIIFYLLFYYQNRIKQVTAAENKEILNEGFSEKNAALTFELSDTKLKDIFSQIENLITTKEPYKDSDFTIAQLSTELKINSKYLAGSLKAAGYTNFNHYLNFYRIEYAKKMIVDSDLSKLTLLYIYTEAGFSNQSTFNRVFKGFEGITPTEYIKNLS